MTVLAIILLGGAVGLLVRILLRELDFRRRGL
jgi:hypothetical protein